MANIKFLGWSVDISQEVASIMAALDDLKAVVLSKFAEVDDALEALKTRADVGDAAVAELAALQSGISEFTSQVDAINPDDPSGDDAPPEPVA